MLVEKNFSVYLSIPRSSKLFYQDGSCNLSAKRTWRVLVLKLCIYGEPDIHFTAAA